MPTDTVITDESHYRTIRNSWGPPSTWLQSNWSARIYTKSSKTYNASQHRVKPDPLTDTLLAKQSTMLQKPARIPWYDCQTAHNTAFKYDIWTQRKWVRTKYTDIVADPAWQNDLLAFIANTKVNLGSSVAEYRETGRMFYQFASAMYEGYQAIKGKASRHREITPCTVAAADLAYAFGVKPLAEDVYSSIEELKLKLGGIQYLNYAHTSRTSADVTKPDYKIGNPDYWAGNITVRNTKSDYLKVRVGLRPDQRSFNFGNPAIWAWELIPYSFVVDWGIGVGAYLEALDAWTSVLSIKGTRTRREQYVHYAKTREKNYLGAWIYSSWHKYSEKSHQRFLQTAIPLPALPRWKPSATWTKVRRAVALLVVAESGRKVDDLVKGPYTHHRNNLCGGAVKRPRKTKRPRKRP